MIISEVCFWEVVRKRKHLFDILYLCNVSIFIYNINNNHNFILSNKSIILKTSKSYIQLLKKVKTEKVVTEAGCQVKGYIAVIDGGGMEE